MFKQLLGMVSNTDHRIPEDLKELLLPHLTHDLYDHQLASLHFVRKVSPMQRCQIGIYSIVARLYSSDCFRGHAQNSVRSSSNVNAVFCWQFGLIALLYTAVLRIGGDSARALSLFFAWCLRHLLADQVLPCSSP